MFAAVALEAAEISGHLYVNQPRLGRQNEFSAPSSNAGTCREPNAGSKDF